MKLKVVKNIGYKSGNTSIEARYNIGINPHRKNEWLVVKHKKEVSGAFSIELHSTKESGVGVKFEKTNPWSETQQSLIELYGFGIYQSGVVLPLKENGKFLFTSRDIDEILTLKDRLTKLAYALTKLY